MKITVTQDHINRGKPAEMGYCPIALAIREQTEFKKAYVGTRVCYFSICSNNNFTQLPQEAIDFIHAFDYNAAVEPFSFELETKQ